MEVLTETHLKTTGGASKKRKRGQEYTLLSGIVATTKMVIVHGDYSTNVIDSTRADLVKDSLLKALDDESELAPNFKEVRHIGWTSWHLLRRGNRKQRSG